MKFRVRSKGNFRVRFTMKFRVRSKGNFRVRFTMAFESKIGCVFYTF